MLRKLESRVGPLAMERAIVRISRDLVCMTRRYRVADTYEGHIITGPDWLFSLVWVRSGQARFVGDVDRAAPPAPFFGLFLPPFHVVRVRWTAADIRAVGVLASAPFDGVPAAVTFRPRPARLPLSVAEVRACVGAGQDVAVVGREPAHALAAAAKRWLDRRQDQPLRMGEVARAVGTSAATLSRVFKRALGLTPLAYRHHVQMMASIVSLCRGKPIVDTAFDVGFSDLGRFYKQFRKLLGATPAAYRALGSVSGGRLS